MEGKISSKDFLEMLQGEITGKSNYQCNLDHNKGRYRYQMLYYCSGYYWTPVSDYAYKRLSSLKRVITMRTVI